jgi:hypothetical protein
MDRLRRGQLEYDQKAMFTSRGPISLDPCIYVSCKGYSALRGGGRGRGEGEWGGRHNIIYHTTIAFIMADFTLFRYSFRGGLYFVTGSSFQILGNENKGKRLVVAKLCGGMYRSSTLRSSRFGFLALLVIHVSLNEKGSLL